MRKASMYYTLDRKTGKVTPTDVVNWSIQYDKKDRSLGNTVITNPVTGKEYVVSTVFLGLNHSFNHHNPPILFETMIFSKDDDWDNHQIRYSTMFGAIKAHNKIVDLIINNQMIKINEVTEENMKKLTIKLNNKVWKTKSKEDL